MRRLCYALVLWVIIASPSWAEGIAAERAGHELVEFLRQTYRPATSLTYRRAREELFTSIDNHGGKVRCVYTGVEVETAGIPDSKVMNTEHTWPQSKFHDRRPMKTDLHHLFAALSAVNQVRGNLPFAEILDEQTESWWRSKAPRREIPSANERDAYSEATESRFEPREDHKGNVARAMFYMWVVYGDDDISPRWIESQLGTLSRWHEQDPVDQAERERGRQISRLQGNENPFVIDPTLVKRIVPARIAPLALAAAERPRGNAQQQPSARRFPDFKLEYQPPKDKYKGPLFRLSQDFPAELPEMDEPTKKILAIEYDDNQPGQKKWLDYLLAVRDYCLEGNIDVQWQGQDNETRRWYHVPWQHFGEKGREGIHGLTREASARPFQLAPTQQGVYQTHAVAMYNARGGYTIGQVWKHQFEPDPSAARFEEGTVVVKILFTQAKEDEVPYLKNPVIWQGFVQDLKDPTKRVVQNLRLLQMDVMVRDNRAKQTGGWVFGTYCYNGDLAESQGDGRWKNLVPVGLQWGNDPQVQSWQENTLNPMPIKTEPNKLLKQTVINDAKHLPAQHLGWGGRLNGPADYYRSSCLSCHSTAQYPPLAPQHPDFQGLEYQPGSKEWMRWFRNLDSGDSFGSPESSGKSGASTDFSLQLSIGLDNFYTWKSALMGGYFVPATQGTPPTAPIPTFAPTSEAPLPTK